MEAQRATELLGQQITASTELDATTELSPDFRKWRRDTEIVIEKIFGKSNRHLSDFKAVHYSSGVFTVGVPESPRESIARFKQGLAAARAVLYSMKEEVEKFGLSGITGGGNFTLEASIPTVKDPRTVFVVHGRNTELRESMFAFLNAIGLHPLEWSVARAGTGEASPYIGRILEYAFSVAQAVVVLMTPDDEAWLKKEFRKADDPLHETTLTGQARPNVLFEAGMAMGREPERTVLVEVGTLRAFSDIVGRHTVKLDNSTEQRQELAQRLNTAGCPVNLAGTRWHKVGSFVLNGATEPSHGRTKETGGIPHASSENTPLVRPILKAQDLRLDTIEVLLVFFEEARSLSAEETAQLAKLKKSVVQFHIEELVKKELLSVYDDSFDKGPPTFWITPEGRAFVVRNDLHK